MDARIRHEVNEIWDDVLDHEYDVLEDVHKSLGPRYCRFADVGCGSHGILGRKGDRLVAFQANSLGLDVDREALLKNVNVGHRVCANIHSLPLMDNSIDVIACRWVFEHIEDPAEVLREVARVLKKGGVLYIKTPNLWNYTMLVSWATPTLFHNVFRLVTGRCENIPTFYRANTKRKLQELAASAGFTIRRLDSYSYSYMYYTFNKELFLTMRGLSRLVGKITNSMQQTLLCVLEKV